MISPQVPIGIVSGGAGVVLAWLAYRFWKRVLSENPRDNADLEAPPEVPPPEGEEVRDDIPVPPLEGEEVRDDIPLLHLQPTFTGRRPPIAFREFTREELNAATNNFSADKLVGQGGFGPVHKGVLTDGTEVAVKSLKRGSSQGNKEFKREIEVYGELNHRNVLTFIGFSLAHRMLVYEYLPNGSLHAHLQGEGRPVMDWPTRKRIILGVGAGLTYLNNYVELPIIHHDIKAENILLTSDFVPKIADFGLAKLYPEGESHVNTGVKGTVGYLDPAYLESGQMSSKVDVWAFGVLIVEVISGRLPTYSTPRHAGLASWGKALIDKGDFKSVIDERLLSYDMQEVSAILTMAQRCLGRQPSQRPEMTEIMLGLDVLEPVPKRRLEEESDSDYKTPQGASPDLGSSSA